MDIFKENNLHPGHDQIIKEYYSEYFDTIFIAFLPFFKIQNSDVSNRCFQKAHEITFEQAQTENEILRKISKPNADIYSYNNNRYPTDKEIFEFAIPVPWCDIKTGCSFSSFGDINKALKTSIGAYKSVFKRQDLMELLSNYTEANQIFYPTEGHFEITSKKEIFKAFHLLNKSEIIIEEEFSFNRKTSDIATITEKEFVDLIAFKDYYIFDKNKEILFAVDWDDFFFLICSNKTNVAKIVSSLNIEGFYCNDTTEAAWELSRQEINAALEKEKMDKQKWWNRK